MRVEESTCRIATALFESDHILDKYAIRVWMALWMRADKEKRPACVCRGLTIPSLAIEAGVPRRVIHDAVDLLTKNGSLEGLTLEWSRPPRCMHIRQHGQHKT